MIKITIVSYRIVFRYLLYYFITYREKQTTGKFCFFVLYIFASNLYYFLYNNCFLNDTIVTNCMNYVLLF